MEHQWELGSRRDRRCSAGLETGEATARFRLRGKDYDYHYFRHRKGLLNPDYGFLSFLGGTERERENSLSKEVALKEKFITLKNDS